eukprot:gnl/MRDRNA2_/MRDRNA2_87313_c0_seq1.p1 gnl/MRDRNA2_/MRDRNA2_87313_c0~~gnl/MRDRNA2_/MRDRNA2_87313_c0_seq1.p1  ORF type:complete len:730 (-),score=258.26 gnl/MRDRNA2_/MRDRNA2_87313_c0_seq1:92-2281(-)
MKVTICFFLALHVFWADAAAVKSHTVESPVEKVIKLLEDLKSSVEDEAKDEAKTYDKFACFCKDNTEEKSTAITDGQSTIDENSATIEKQTQEKENAEADLKKALEDIEKVSSEIKADEVKRAKEKAEYDAVQADLSKAVDSIENAIKALTPKLLQFSSLGKADFKQLRMTIRKSAALADLLGVKPKLRRAVHALLQTSEDREVPENDYEFHSQEILDVLDELKKDFQANLDEKIEEGEAAKKAHDELMEKKQAELETADGQKTDAEEAIEECKRQITDATEALIAAEKDLKDDQTYLKDLTERCESKAKEWDQRASMRAKEVEAITKALEIIEGGAKGKLPKKAPEDFLQSKDNDDVATAVDPEPHQFTSLMEDDVGDLGLALVQESQAPRSRALRLLQNSRARLTPDDGTTKAIAVLASEAKRLNSAVLEAFVTNIGADPFKKVKSMIHSMIEKLMAEAVDEANHKGFCDSEIAKAVGNRDSFNEKSETLMAKLADLDVKKEELTELIETTEEDLKTLQEALDKAKKLRDEEKEENAMTLKDAKEGLTAIKSAIEMLEEFYRGAAHVKVLIQRGVEDDLPEGSENKGAYKGNQEGGRKVIEMLKEVAGNFKEAIKEVEDADAESRRQFVNFDRESKASISEKETGKRQAESDLKSTEIAIVQSHEDLTDTQKMLDGALKELAELRPACDVGLSVKNRADAREGEIKALKKAICILDATASGEDVGKC